MKQLAGQVSLLYRYTQILIRQLKEYDLEEYTNTLENKGFYCVQILAQQPIEIQESLFQNINLQRGHYQRFKNMIMHRVKGQIVRTPSRQRDSQPGNYLSEKQKATRPKIFSTQLQKLQSYSISIIFKGMLDKRILQVLLIKKESFSKILEEISLRIGAAKIRISEVNLKNDSISFQIVFHQDDFKIEKTEQDMKEYFIDQLQIFQIFNNDDFAGLLGYLSLKFYEFEQKFRVIVEFHDQIDIIGMQKSIVEVESQIYLMKYNEKQQNHIVEVQNKLTFIKLINLHENSLLCQGILAQISFTEDQKIKLITQKSILPRLLNKIENWIEIIQSTYLKTTNSGFSEQEINYIKKNFQQKISFLQSQNQVLIIFSETAKEIVNVKFRIMQRYKKNHSLMKIQSFDENLNNLIIKFFKEELQNVRVQIKLIIPILTQQDLNRFINFIFSFSPKVVGYVQSGNLIIIEMLENMEQQIEQFFHQITQREIQNSQEWQQQYDQLLNTDSLVYSLELLSVKDSQKIRIQMPVVTNKCKPHPRSCLTFIDACKQLNQNNQIVCQCGESVNQLNNLVKDIRQQAYQQFHPIVDQIQIIQGLLCHKYNRKKKYIDQINQADQIMPNFLQILRLKTQSSNSFSDRIKNIFELENKAYFWACCLLDKVKIVIPVRIKDCQHPECYELTSLLDYQIKEKDKENKNIFQCLYPKCQQIMNIQTLQTMIEVLILDEELLKILNNGLPSQIKFIFDKKTQRLTDGIQIINGISIDPFILKCYEDMVPLEDQKTINYIDFQAQVQNFVAQVMQAEISDVIEERLRKCEYNAETIINIDQYKDTELVFPVRCTECQNYNKFIDCRCFTAHYFVTKRKRQKNIKCLLCGFEFNCLSKSICNMIYCDRNLISKMVLGQRINQLYSTLPQFDLSKISFEYLDIRERIENPVLLQECKHLSIKCLTYSEAKYQFEAKKEITCYCGNTTQDFSDLMRDIRDQVYEQFHQQVQYVQVVQGILIHKYLRGDKFENLLKETELKVPKFLLELKNRSLQSHTISSIIRAKQIQQNYQYLSFCLLDGVKITIPVRIKNCFHPECYELTSLLAYQNENSNGKFECFHPDCTNSINIDSLQNLLDNLYMDIELLSILNKSLPDQFRFIYSPNKQKFKLTSHNAADSMIMIFFQQQLTEQEQQVLKFEEFIFKVGQLTAQAIQYQEKYSIQEKKENQEKFQTIIIDLTDPFTEQLIQFPVRCFQCKQQDRYCDIITFTASYVLAKLRNQLHYLCPICGSKYELIGDNLTNIIYCDRNLSFRMQIEMPILTNREFKYQGKQYFLQWFIKFQNFRLEDYILELKDKNLSTIVEFSLFQCPPNLKKRIQIPLILKDCPEKSVIDLDTLYQKMIELNFNIEGEKDFQFCNCAYCNSHPLKSYLKKIYYHDALGKAISLKGIQISSDQQLKFDLKRKKLLPVVVFEMRGPLYLENDFIDMMDDDEYQDLFMQLSFKQEKWQGHIISMEQQLLDGLLIRHDKKGLTSNLKVFFYNMNQNANANLFKHQFKVTKIVIELNSDICKLNRGHFYYC